MWADKASLFPFADLEVSVRSQPNAVRNSFFKRLNRTSHSLGGVEIPRDRADALIVLPSHLVEYPSCARIEPRIAFEDEDVIQCFLATFIHTSGTTVLQHNQPFFHHKVHAYLPEQSTEYCLFVGHQTPSYRNHTGAMGACVQRALCAHHNRCRDQRLFLLSFRQKVDAIKYGTTVPCRILHYNHFFSYNLQLYVHSPVFMPQR